MTEDHYHELFRLSDYSPIAQFAINLEHRIIHWNRSCERLTGFSAAEMLGSDRQWEPFYDRKRPVLADLILLDDFEEFCRLYHDQNPSRSSLVSRAWEATGFFQDIGGMARYIYFLAAPIFDDRNRVIGAIETLQDITEQKQRALVAEKEYGNLLQENMRLRSAIRERYRFGDLIGKSRAMQEVYDLIAKVAASDIPAIIYGESGTGKELAARTIHELSARRHEAFVPVHCGAIPDNLVESEFFGHKKGAFTGAHADQPGYLDRANRGTLFLDEVGEISLPMQVKLLRVLEGGGFAPVGSNVIRIPDLRVIAATSRNLREMVANGGMREDFFFRIHVIPIQLPPLRTRKEDLRLLVDHFLAIYGDTEKSPVLPDSVRELLNSYDWPGNVRELQNVLHRYLTLEKLDLNDTAQPDGDNTQPERTVVAPIQSDFAGLRTSMDGFERKQIETALERNQWHKGRTAVSLGISRKTLFRKMKKIGLV
ncbi:MAG: hypothetical protein A2521_07910 [Deltaproteobacteria bacterium RIFOXYD12_FULL_57_12]|nr:MAG: hypothetical protein A2521_07910 [Deltaproteobacteria bacterium RIFOXYD12_FULL_57_12]